MNSQSLLTNLRVCVVGAGKMGADRIERLTRRIVGAEVSAVVEADVSRARKAVEEIPTAAAVSDIGRALDWKMLTQSLSRPPVFSTETCCFRFWSGICRFSARNH